MKLFKINEKIEVVCESENTRSGFRHLATLFVEGVETQKAKCCYQNRTWERYKFQSVLFSVISKSNLSEEDKKICNEFIEGKQEDMSMFRTTSMVAMMGDLLCNSQKEKNDWKKRMLVAGLGDLGLEMPEDWDCLDEDTKQSRLDNIIKMSRGAGEKNGI